MYETTRAKRFFDTSLNVFLGFAVVFGLLMVQFGPPKSLDVKLYYSGDEARALLKTFSAADLRVYFVNEILDLFFYYRKQF